MTFAAKMEPLPGEFRMSDNRKSTGVDSKNYPKSGNQLPGLDCCLYTNAVR